ncbi:MAG: DUF883 domain-containing protein [Burkholderiales bacterium]|jgi:ElaB/YqjD/DUF883 family membrane-anchored ribosome-binding protein|nr:DUF883 domain-containing protein [Burkholderiales bacterium]
MDDDTLTPARVSGEKLGTDLKVVLADVETLLKQAASSTGQQAVELRERAAENLHRASLRLSEARVAAAEKSRAAARRADDWVHEKPWAAVGAAAGIGFLLGMLVSRR